MVFEEPLRPYRLCARQWYVIQFGASDWTVEQIKETCRGVLFSFFGACRCWAE